MKACDKMLQSVLMEAMELDKVRLEEEMKSAEPHVFSEEFESKMEALLKVRKRKEKVHRFVRYAACAAFIALLTLAIMFINSEDLRASEVSIHIVDWLEEFFAVEDGVKGRKEVDVLFDESQIGYLPEGFEKVAESERFSRVEYMYENDLNERFTIRVFRDKLQHISDSEEVENAMPMSENGFEYMLIVKEEPYSEILMWSDKDGIYYAVIGNMVHEELVKIMEEITYEE